MLLMLCSLTNMEKLPHAEIAQAESPVIYAGFWLRVVAALVDSLTLFIPLCIVASIVLLIVRLISAARGGYPTVLIISVTCSALMIATWLYFAVMESSSWQATFGKKFLGLYVTDLGGHRLTLGRATARTFAKYLSSMTAGIGYLVCGFTEKKQALHDMVANCLVLRRPR